MNDLKEKVESKIIPALLYSSAALSKSGRHLSRDVFKLFGKLKKIEGGKKSINKKILRKNESL